MSTKKFGIVAGIVLTLSVVVSPAFAACSLTTMSECDNNGLMTLIASLLGGSSTTTTTTTTTGASISGIPAGFTFTTNLKQGSTGNDVKYLQVLLNSNAATSIGNAGKETTYFGAMTKAAVVKFQNFYKSETLTPYGLTAGTGFFGSSSRAKANALIAGGTTGTVTTYPAGCTSSTGYSSTTGQSCAGGTTTTPVVVGSGFTVALATNNPVSGTFVQGQSTANLANYTFSNGTSTPVVVTSVTLDRIGISADATLANVYLFDGAVRLTDAASVSAGKVTFNTVGGIFTIPANSAKIISVKSDLALATSGQTVGAALSAVVSNGTLASTLPIAGNLHNIASADLATVVIGAGVPSTGTPTTDAVSGVRIWEAPFTVGTRNVQFTKLALKQINSIDKADISNFQLLIDGVVVSTVANLDANGYVTFTFDKTLTTGTRTVKVLADVTGGSSRYIQMSLRNKADIDVKDADYGVNVSVTLGAPAVAIQVNVGALSITADNSALPVTVANSSSNVLIGKWKFKASGEAVKVETLKAAVLYSNPDNSNQNATPIDAATLRNGKIMINGAQAGSTATLVQDITGVEGTTYTVNYTFQPGIETTVELYADIFDNDGDNAIVNGDSIQGELVIGSGNATKQISLGLLPVPSSNKTASAIQVSTAGATATLTATSNYGTTQNTVLPQTAFKIGSWTMTAGTSEDININSLSFAIAELNNAAGGNNFTVADMNDMYVTYQVGSGSAVTTSVTPTPTDPTAFSTSFTLPKGQTVVINLYSNLSGVADNLDSVQATLTVAGTGAQSSATVSKTAIGQAIVNTTGSLTISKSASTPVATLVTGNNTVKTVSYKFEALNDSYTISQLTFGITDPSAVSSVNLKDGTTILTSAAAAASVIFNLSTPITISANTYKTIDVELVLGNIGSGAGTSSANIATDLTDALVRPASSGQADVLDNTEMTSATSGNAIYVYKAIPTITLSTLPSGNLASGTNTIAKFTVGSDTGTIAWKKIKFAVSKSDASAPGTSDLGAITDVTLWNGSTQILGAASINNLGAGSSTGSITFIPNTEEQVAGSTTYTLKANIAGTIATGDSINTRIDTGVSAFDISKAALTVAPGTGDAATYTYYDADSTSTVTAGDVRQTAVNSYTASGNATGASARTMTYALTSFGTSTAVVVGTLNLTYTHAGPTWAVAAGGTATGWSVSSGNASSVTLSNTSGAQIVATPATAMSGDAVLTVTIATGTAYAANSVVATGNTDLGKGLGADSTAVSKLATFIWSDLSQPSHSATTTDWTSDFLVKNVPTDTQNLTK